MHPQSIRLIVVVALFGSLATGMRPATAQPDGGAPFQPPVESPEVQDDGSVVFRIRADKAETVQLASSDLFAFGQSAELKTNDAGIWETTLKETPAGAYRYRFDIDGVSVIDPANNSTSEVNAGVWSLLHIPGATWMDAGKERHGAVAEVHYFSTPLDRMRRMHVYTPPGYAMDPQQDYPVLYLLHGAMDCDDSWSTVGRAGYILDQLIARGEAEPMIVVMPAGHTGPFRFGRNSIPIDEFSEDFTQAIRPYIEANYRVRSGRANRAIAGLSMGGAQTLNIAFENLADYAFVGVFSSGVFGITGRGPGSPNGDRPSWREQHQTSLEDSELKQGLKKVWFATGRDDFLLETSRATVDMLKENGFDVDFEETDGGHTWTNWREYLHTFAQYLFRDDPEIVQLPESSAQPASAEQPQAP
ncbi:hypothetical protein FYK55_23330 [Roseiconus nitratireducens]|uniref:Glycoside hydrolase family 13 N-terminal domain-containing protein n=1 Tax=Roseiconus nitratireducens TaxID=2605748 RepID=A0A5M6CWX8_9BACT|nr:alpha/beta fold hydrolase [Roseiconus nitratireducens]KAA5539734.1 hypothetical protein FYK55_23330 [Roseiconus nitratireducens]